jgi:hypothetical protein
MKLYLVQHGEAMLETENPERPLTARGRRWLQPEHEAGLASHLQALSAHPELVEGWRESFSATCYTAGSGVRPCIGSCGRTGTS